MTESLSKKEQADNTSEDYRVSVVQSRKHEKYTGGGTGYFTEDDEEEERLSDELKVNDVLVFDRSETFESQPKEVIIDRLKILLTKVLQLLSECDALQFSEPEIGADFRRIKATLSQMKKNISSLKDSDIAFYMGQCDKLDETISRATVTKRLLPGPKSELAMNVKPMDNVVDHVNWGVDYVT
uniref:Uncharacterized protein n=1 Tax=Panagrolaimus sp. JU765 TaxID=591449 RepID=A0AC34RC20_9BILA